MLPDRRRLRTAALRRRLLAGVGAVALVASGGAAYAQQASSAPAQPGPDGLAPDAVYLEADSTIRTGDTLTATSNGEERVLARFRNTTLRAGEFRYDLNLGVASARDRVEFTDDAGNQVFASQLQLDSELRAGVAVDFATRFRNGASLMAATAVRRGENLNELNYAIFTPCPICDTDGSPKQPSISIQAEKVVQDESLRAILYRNAVFRIGGVPVFYMPVFSHPDPTVDRASGFLVPVPSYDEGRGYSLEVPYLQVISPSEDWLISPQFNTDVAPFLNLQWRRRFSDGTIVLRGGYTYERNFGDEPFGDRTNRSYFLGHGDFDPEGPWRWGFTAERTSDKTLFDRYDVRDPYQDNGLYYGDQRRLISQLYAERQTERSYLSVAAFSIQSLRVKEFDFANPALNIFESDGELPLVAPLIEARWEPDGPVFGGRLRLRGSAVALSRDDYIGSPVLRPEIIPAVPTIGYPGVDTRRVTGQAEWRRTMITSAGLRFEPFIDVRADLYSISDLPPMMGVEGGTITRSRATAGVDVSFPLIRRIGAGADLILEPMAQLSISTDPDYDSRIPNEDSPALELDESSLFRVDRFPGYDQLEGGMRFTTGGRATLRWGDGRQASLFVGRSFREEADTAFLTPVPGGAPGQLYDPSGLSADTSDWVVQGSFSPSDRIRGWAHATIDSSGDVRRAEVAVDGRWGRRNLATLSYVVDRSNPLASADSRNYEFVQLAGQQFIYGNWGIAASGIADMERNLITRSEVGLLFDDDCFRFELGWRRDNTQVRPSGPSEGIYIRLNLATFGGTG
ncbi:LPS-assembly protein LptD [Brevundimonas sp. M20]|uniref:LPS-assembly protein LptD n=1 Tax=Brevundimonas sp. M20 TaxID=2591463 RepID=UPI00114781E7|nr:LPS assembly protein LptD [Brevundimonas sp. M20]QDH73129.1 LPS-assembly protein LptD [Brevundimonas sp. M20]